MAEDTEVTGVRPRLRAARQCDGRLVLASIGAFLAVLLATTASALASTGTQALVGEGENGLSPSSVTATMHVKASETGGVTSGTLTTAGKVSSGTFAQFKGNVTCIKSTGSLVLVGAVGTASLLPNEGPPKPLPGTYAQTLSVELGSFTDPNLEESPIFTFRFGILGEHGEGIETTSAPTCATGPSATELPTFGGSVSYTSTPGEPEPTPEPCTHHPHDTRGRGAWAGTDERCDCPTGPCHDGRDDHGHQAHRDRGCGEARGRRG